jgi:hypothetical protein
LVNAMLLIPLNYTPPHPSGIPVGGWNVLVC